MIVHVAAKPIADVQRAILFSGPMVRAILAGTKTQTRRVVTPQPQRVSRSEFEWRGGLCDAAWMLARCPYGVPGDRLWVRETFAHDQGETLYAADCQPEDLAEERKIRREFPGIGAEFPGGKWRPSIFMPRWASRITLEVTAVRVERLQDISEQDARAEGANARGPFAFGWDLLNAKRGYGWASNPWVWVIGFVPLPR